MWMSYSIIRIGRYIQLQNGTSTTLRIQSRRKECASKLSCMLDECA